MKQILKNCLIATYFFVAMGILIFTMFSPFMMAFDALSPYWLFLLLPLTILIIVTQGICFKWISENINL